MPEITYPGVEGVADVPDKVLPFWLRNGWSLVVDEPALVSAPVPAPVPVPARPRRATSKPSTASAVADSDSTGGRDHSTTSTEETP